MDFANKYKLPFKPVVLPPGADAATYSVGKDAYTDDGTLYNSQVLATIPITRLVYFPDNFAGSAFSCKTNPSATTNIACDAATGSPAVLDQRLDAGTYYLIVEAPDGATSDFNLRVFLSDP